MLDLWVMGTLLMCCLPGVPLCWARVSTRQLPPSLHVPAHLWGVLPLWHSRGQHTDRGKQLREVQSNHFCGWILIIVLTFQFNYKRRAAPQTTDCTVLMLNKCCRCSEAQFRSWSFLGPAVLHLLPRLTAGPGAGQIQGAVTPPQQPADPEPCRPPDAGFWPLRQPCPPGPHHHIQWQGKRQDPQETGGTRTGTF